MTNQMDYIVLENTSSRNSNGSDFFVTNRDDFKKQRYCETYNEQGYQNECHDAQCYSLDNGNNSNFIEDAIYWVADYLNIPELVDSLDLEADNWEDIIYDYDGICKETAIRFLEKWELENEHHGKCLAYDYWDGSNWKSIVIEHEWFDEHLYVEADKETHIKVLAEKPEVHFIENATETIETENYTFFYSLFSNNPWLFEATEI